MVMIEKLIASESPIESQRQLQYDLELLTHIPVEDFLEMWDEKPIKKRKKSHRGKGGGRLDRATRLNVAMASIISLVINKTESYW
jgi:hypothetical protein